jgi:hypothetical protein
MAIRDRLIARCQKLLPADTQIRHYFIVAVTANEIFVLRASCWWPTYPEALEARLPRNHLFNLDREWDDLNADITLMGNTYRVFCTHFDEVEAADAELKPPPPVDERAIMASIMASRAAVFRRWASDGI